MDKLKDTGSRENHGCDGLTASRKQLAYDWKTSEKQYKIGKKWRTLVEEKTRKCEVNSGKGNGKPLLYS